MSHPSAPVGRQNCDRQPDPHGIAVVVIRCCDGRPAIEVPADRIQIVPRHTGFASLLLHGGKTPPWLFDKTIEILNKAINRSAIDRSEKVKAFRRLAKFSEPTHA